MLQKDRPERFSSLSEDALAAFNALKEAISTAPALQLPDFSKPFEIETDASKYGFGCVLLQRDADDNLRPCGYYSWSTTPLERHWTHPNKLEARALVWAVDKLDFFLRSRPFVIRTDARNLLWLLNGNYQTGLYARWVLKLSSYSFEIKHATVPVSDALSRAASFETAEDDQSDDAEAKDTTGNDENAKFAEKFAEKCEFETAVSSKAVPAVVGAVQVVTTAPTQDASTGAGSDSKGQQNVAVMVTDLSASIATPFAVGILPAKPRLEITLENVVKEQKNDTFCMAIMYCIERGIDLNGFFFDGLVLRRHYKDDSGEYETLLMPSSMRTAAIEGVHHSAITGHLGLHKTLAILRRQFYWPGMRSSDVTRFVHTCHVCQMNKATKHPRYGQLNPIPYAFPMDTVSADYVGPFAPVTL